MAEKFLSIKNLKFLLYDVFDAESIVTCHYYKQYDRKMFEVILGAATELAEDLLWPIFQEMDRNPPQLVNDQVIVHPVMKKIMNEFGKGGWIAATLPEHSGGEQLPHLVADSCRFIFMAANYSAYAYAGLTASAARLIESFADKKIIKAFVPKMLKGEWQGTMALTEPEAGSSLSDIATVAEYTGKGHYKIKGQKIFISAGDHNSVENVVHLLLARIKGAPGGVKGISLFVVPKLRMGENGSLIANDIVTSGVFHKLGYRGCPIVQLSIGEKGDCNGFLVGKANNGLRYMFQMMNEARIGVGMGATAMATAAYYASLQYTKLRKQGRTILNKDPSLPQVPIIEHPDVKRMLLFQRSVIEGSLSLLMQCSKYMDMQKICDPDEKEKYGLLLEILTPVAKSFPSEMGILSISQGLQCFGGSGYCDDYPIEQYYRDVRIHPIHEGTTGIHGLTLLGRNLFIKNGKAYELYLDETLKTIKSAREVPELKPYAQDLLESVELLKEVTEHLLILYKKGDIENFLADATIYLEVFGIITISWQWLVQAIAIKKAFNKKALTKGIVGFLQGKFYTFRYFFEYELPKIHGLVKSLKNTNGLTVEIRKENFTD